MSKAYTEAIKEVRKRRSRRAKAQAGINTAYNLLVQAMEKHNKKYFLDYVGKDEEEILEIPEKALEISSIKLKKALKKQEE